MAEAVAQPRRHAYRFFCHRCNVEFEDVIQDYTCPYCATGFIERLENDRDGESLNTLDDGEYSDAEMSNIDDASNADDSILGDSLDDGQGPVLNDIAFLMSGGRIRPGRRHETLMDHFLSMLGGARPATGAVTAGAPFVLVGAPGDYVFGGEGLDAVVTQLLGQLENTGPPPLPHEQIAAIPNDQITAEQVEANMSCSVCWDNFTLNETVSRLECEHMFHPACISPWLALHATCPVCRRSLLPAGEAAAGAAGAAGAAPGAGAGAPPAAATPSSSSTSSTSVMSGASEPASSSSSSSEVRFVPAGGYSRVVVRRVPARRRRGWPEAGGLWAALAGELAPPPSSSASSRATDTDRQYMDIDYD